MKPLRFSEVASRINRDQGNDKEEQGQNNATIWMTADICRIRAHAPATIKLRSTEHAACAAPVRHHAAMVRACHCVSHRGKRIASF